MSPSSPQRAEAGVVIGGYELVRRLGRGGMAEVWVARRSLGQKGTKFVAIKLLADHYVGEERYARMFRAEAELAALLSHANIVQVFDEGEEDGRSYLVMEWVDGLNLLKLGAVLALLDDEERRCRIIAYTIGQLLYALGYAHSITSHDGSPLGVVHRDVSPQNVMVSNHGEVKLTDFGVAFQAMEESSGIHVKGKVRYMSPEQLSGKTRSPTVDLYAVGALLQELLDGKKFRGEYDDGQDLFAIVLSGELPQMSRPVPPELDDLRLRLLEPDPTERIQTAEEAIAWLQRYPGYGDARGELAKLCNSLTGVVRPRAGPGQSGLAPAADRRKGLARPKVSPRPAKPAPPRPPAARPQKPSMSQRTSSSTALKRPQPATPNITGPNITGQTELVRPQQPSGAGKKRVFTTPSPPAAAVASAPASPGYGAEPVQAAVPDLIETHAPPSRSPMPVHASSQDPQLAPTEIHATPSQPISVGEPYGPDSSSASPVPHVVHEQASYQIPVHAEAAAPFAPTERLGRSETSGLRPPPVGTEVLDPNMIIEVTSGSGTEQEIYPQVALREGTDTSREISPQPLNQSHSISIVLPRRSALAGIGVGLVMVALLSVTVTWWLFTRSQDADVQVAARDAAPSASSNGVAAAVEPVEDTTKEVVATDHPVPVPSRSVEEPAEAPATEVAADIADELQDGNGGTLEAGDAKEQTTNEGEPEESMALDDAEGSTEEELVDPAGNSEQPPVEAPRVDDEPEPVPPPKRKESAVVVINALPGMQGAQVKIGSKQLTIPDSRKITKKVRPGTTKVAWRKNASVKSWTKAASLSLSSGKTTKLLLTAGGIKEL